MKWKPARCIHQVTAFQPDISQPFIRQRSSFRRGQRPAPANSYRHRLSRRHNLSKIDTDIWPQRPRAHRILDKTGENLFILFYAIDVQRTIQFEHHRARGLQRHEGYVRAGAKGVFIGIQLPVDAIVGDVITSAAGGLLLSVSSRAETPDGKEAYGYLKS